MLRIRRINFVDEFTRMLNALVLVSLEVLTQHLFGRESGEVNNLLLKLIIMGNENIIPDISNINYIKSQCSHTL